ITKPKLPSETRESLLGFSLACVLLLLLPLAPCSHIHVNPASKMVKGSQGERVRLYVRGSILGYKRSKSNQYPSTSLIQIEGVNTKEEVAWYSGKKMAYIYKAKTKKNGSHYRCIWGKVTRPHGNTGVVRAKFKSNLPPKSMVIHHLSSFFIALVFL
ncbi:hypothetical protein V2J09_013403, partial [Rumex salicifolius]